MSLFELSATKAAALIRAKEISPVELVDAVLARIETVEGSLGAYSLVLADEAREAAKRAEQDLMDGLPVNALHGVPIALKDLIDVAGLPTSCSSRVRDDHVASTDAAVTTRLRRAGAILAGKTHTHEFAFGLTTPQTGNPWNTRHTPGGSSGGSAAAVSYGGALAALGTDTGGSIRVPAALCGVVGLKPTRNLVPLEGVFPLAASLDHVGPITRTVDDAALMLEVLVSDDVARAPDPCGKAGPPANPDLKGLKLGVPTNYFYDRLEPEIEASLRGLHRSLQDAGAELVEIQVPLTDRILPAQWGIMLPEAAFVHRDHIRERADRFGEDVRSLLEAGALLPAGDYLLAKQAQEQMRHAWSILFQKVDALVVPTVPQVAARRDQEAFTWPDGTRETVVEAYVRLNAGANLTGVPALTVPAGVHSSGLPFGLQFIAGHRAENVLLRLGRTVEAVRGREFGLADMQSERTRGAEA